MEHPFFGGEAVSRFLSCPDLLIRQKKQVKAKIIHVIVVFASL